MSLRRSAVKAETAIIANLGGLNIHNYCRFVVVRDFYFYCYY